MIADGTSKQVLIIKFFFLEYFCVIFPPVDVRTVVSTYNKLFIKACIIIAHCCGRDSTKIASSNNDSVGISGAVAM